MSEAILTEKQLKKALRSKKTNKQTIKNVLSTSEELQWPVLKGNDLNTLKKGLETYLPKIRSEKISIKYSEIKDLNKEQRKEYRQSKTEVINSNVDRECIVFGLNQVNRLVVNKQASFILISSDVNPRFMLEGLVRDCTTCKIPYLLIPDLKTLLGKFCGIRSMVIGIGIKNCSKLDLLKEIFEKVYKNYDLNFNNLNLSESNEISECEIRKEEVIKENVEIKTNNLKETDKEDLKSSFQPEDVYLKRTDRSKRVFQPNEDNSEKKETNKSDFIGFGSFNYSNKTSKDVTNKKCKSNYKPLVVKRIKSDPDRSKKKFKKSKSVN